ncbi:MAG: uroporphyrinogen-III synthase [Rubrivivax sp.]|nr:uroporphyrinogen-III synthase [Rubrivivax sp.]
MRVVVTRPAAQAHELVHALAERGVPALALPLIGIEPLADPAARRALAAAWSTLAGRQLVMFVSANAVAAFFAAVPDGASTRRWPARTLAAATGPGTASALRAAGVPEDRIVAPGDDAVQLDSEALWQRLRGRSWRGAQVLVVRGDGGGREWLAQTLRAAGARVELLAAYRRTLPGWSAAEAALFAEAEAAPSAHAWHFSSSEAVHNLARLAPAGTWRGSIALVTHPRIGEAARAAGFVQVHELAPGLPALVHAVRALRHGELPGAAGGAPTDVSTRGPLRGPSMPPRAGPR